jgi:hypothetical protein
MVFVRPRVFLVRTQEDHVDDAIVCRPISKIIVLSRTGSCFPYVFEEVDTAGTRSSSSGRDSLGRGHHSSQPEQPGYPRHRGTFDIEGDFRQLLRLAVFPLAWKRRVQIPCRAEGLSSCSDGSRYRVQFVVMPRCASPRGMSPANPRPTCLQRSSPSRRVVL